MIRRWHIIANFDNIYFGVPREITSHYVDCIYDFGSYLDENGELKIRAIYSYGDALYYAEYIK